MNALVKPEPAVSPAPKIGDVYWLWGDTIFAIAAIETVGQTFLYSDHTDQDRARRATDTDFWGARYLGTLDELRARATAEWEPGYTYVKGPFDQGPFWVDEDDPSWVDGPEGYDWKFESAEKAKAHVSDLNFAYAVGLSHAGNRGDLLYTDNSAVVAKLSAENERLRAAAKALLHNGGTGPYGCFSPPEFYQGLQDALAAVEGDAA
jgi:hypothetical protein